MSSFHPPPTYSTSYAQPSNKPNHSNWRPSFAKLINYNSQPTGINTYLLYCFPASQNEIIKTTQPIQRYIWSIVASLFRKINNQFNPAPFLKLNN